jgi:subtilase family serine protease
VDFEEIMTRRGAIASAVALTATMAGLVVAGAGTAANAAATPTPHVIPGSAVSFTSRTAAVGTVAGSRKLTVQLWLTPRTAAAEAYATGASTPGSATYGHYLSPSAYTAQFGATAAEAATTESWLRAQGFTHIGTDAQRDYVTATAPVTTINTAFHTQLKYYKATSGASAGRHALYANDSALTLPSSLASTVLGVTGLDNAQPVLPLETAQSSSATPADSTTGACSTYYGENTVTLGLEQFGTTTYPTPVCGYSAKQLRSAYGANSVNTGKGQKIALVELGLAPGMFGTLQLYAQNNGIAAPAAARYKEVSLGGTLAACGDPFDGEEQLDVEAAYDMAPGATEYVVGGNACDTGYEGLQGLFDADLKVLSGNGKQPLASVVSNSWESGTEGQPAVYINIEHAFLVKAAAEGVGMYFSSGDNPGVKAPSSDPYAIAVGGTTLGIGQTGHRLFETGWSTDVRIQEGTWTDYGINASTGGGPSQLWKQPAYQKGVVPKALATTAGNLGGLRRSVPDISADADPYTGMSIVYPQWTTSGVVYNYNTVTVGGTSLAAPLVAGMVTAAQQGQPKPFGFIDPALYKLANTSAFTDARPLTSKSPAAYRATGCDSRLCGIQMLLEFDNQSLTTPGYNGQVTLKGYDNMTGLGTPHGQTFITDLRNLLK